MDWSGVDYLGIIIMFLSAVGTLILTAPIHCRGSIGDAMLKLIYILDRLKVNFCLKYSFAVARTFWMVFYDDMQTYGIFLLFILHQGKIIAKREKKKLSNLRFDSGPLHKQCGMSYMTGQRFVQIPNPDYEPYNTTNDITSKLQNTKKEGDR